LCRQPKAAEWRLLCDLEEIALNDMVIFRVLNNPREYIEAFEEAEGIT
jgi:hypothetical protein